MSDHMQINDGAYVHLDSVKRLHVATSKDIESLRKLGSHVQADRFSTRLEYADGSTEYATETIDEIAAQGVALVEVDEGSFVPRQNIIKARDLTDKDRREFKQRRGRVLRGDFKSQVETRSGLVLSTADSATVMRRMSHPYQPATAMPESQKNAPNLSEQRDAMMAEAAMDKSKAQKTNGRKATKQQEPSQ